MLGAILKNLQGPLTQPPAPELGAGALPYRRPYVDPSFYRTPAPGNVYPLFLPVLPDASNFLRADRGRPLVYDWQRSPIAPDGLQAFGRETFSEPRSYTPRRVDYTHTASPTPADHTQEQGKGEFPADLKPFTRPPLLQDWQRAPQAPDDLQAFGQEFPVDVRPYARRPLTHDWSQVPQPPAAYPSFGHEFPNDLSLFKRPPLPADWQRAPTPPNDEQSFGQEFPRELSLYKRPPIPADLQRTPTPPNNDQGGREVPTDLGRIYARKPIVYDFEQAPLPGNAFQPPQPELPWDLGGIYTRKPLPTQRWEQAPTPFNNEQAKAEIPADLGIYTRKPLVYDWERAPQVPDFNPGQPRAELPDAWLLAYRRPGVPFDWVLAPPPIKPSGAGGATSEGDGKKKAPKITTPPRRLQTRDAREIADEEAFLAMLLGLLEEGEL